MMDKSGKHEADGTAVKLERKGPLQGLKVLDLSRVLAAPWAAQLLADLGADVIKVERPGQGDEARTYGAPYLRDAEGRETLDNAFYLSANRGKRSITLDLATPEGQDIVRRLATRSDVLLENFRTGALKKYGLDYAALSAINPGLVYCSVTGFGQTGPLRHRPGYDAVFQGMGGLMSVTGPKDGAPGAGPVKVGPSIVDILCGLFSSTAILAALHDRRETGMGQHVDVALLDSVVAAMSHYAQIYLISRENPVRRGTEGNGGCPSQMFRCGDGEIMITAGNDAHFARLCAVLGMPELARDARFISNNRRIDHRDLLTSILDDAFRQRSVADTLAALEAADVPSGPINTLAQVFEDAQVLARNMLVKVKHSAAGELPLVGNPIHYSRTALGDFRAPPTIGEHTREILTQVLSMGEAEIDGLRRKGVV